MVGHVCPGGMCACGGHVCPWGVYMPRGGVHAWGQECIPVGCIPPASVAVFGGGGCLPGGVCQAGLPGGGVCLGGVCLPHTPVNRMTDRLV